MLKAAALLFGIAGALAAAEPATPAEFFEMRIRPLLAASCFSCHTSSRMGGLEMASRATLLKGGSSGPAIVPGEPDNSLLIQAVRHTHPRLKMPLNGKLDQQQVADLAAWVKAGAVWPDSPAAAPTPAPKTGEFVIRPEHRGFWAFQPVRKPAPPAVANKTWPRSPIDRFVLAKLEAQGLRPVKPAAKRALVRRAYYDLTGLPPAPEDVDAFLKDTSPDAFAKIVDRLLASPRYGERWGRYWLDVARYSDDKLNSTQEEPYPNAFRYRDWVIQSFNQDLPYDVFVKAQIAGDLFDGGKHAAGLGFYALRPEFQDDRVDATARGFLGLTVACAQCHDHKFDPIPTKDYYSLLGVFTSTDNHEIPLASDDVVRDYKERKKKVDAQKEAIKKFIDAQSVELGEILAARTARYLAAAWKALGPSKADPAQLVRDAGIDQETLERWMAYLKNATREHPYLKPFDELLQRGGPEPEVRKAAEEFEELVLAVIREKKEVEETNLIRLGGSKERRALSSANLVSLDRDKYFLWRDLFSERRGNLSFTFSGGVYYYGEKTIERFLAGEWKAHLESMRAELKELESALPAQYPFLHAIQDVAKPANQRIHLRGNRDMLGDEAPRRFLAVLSNGQPAPFTKGSGRLELAEAMASPANPLTARVMANRIWLHHFGNGIVRTPSNFGALGERPTHPELLDYLAARFVESGWSIKALHREIMLSATYALSAENAAKNLDVDPDNRLLWRANRRRLDIEALRDSLFYVAGNLNPAAGGPPERADAAARRTVYSYVSRRKPDALMALFDFPNPNSTSEQRIITNVPLQRLFFLNSDLILRQSEALAKRVQAGGGGDAAAIGRAYRLLFGRAPAPAETRLGLEFLQPGPQSWPKYAQVLLGSNEFLFVN